MNAVEFKNITKKFGNFTANDSITFAVEYNTIHCIVGENGAGKSTLMNILYGLITPDSGQLLVNGDAVSFNSPHDAIAMKIGMVHQHFMLIDDFTVFENVILGQEPVKGISIDQKKGLKKMKSLIDEYDLNLNPDSRVSELSISMQQKVEILKLLYRDSEVLIFDEPTAVLSPVEVDMFVKMADNFRNSGKTIIVITHKLREVERMADRITVLRRGTVVLNSASGNRSPDMTEVSRAIIGKSELSSIHEKTYSGIEGPILLGLKNISLEKNKRKYLDKLSIELRAGEIHGIAGVEGNGQSEIADIVCGLEKNFEGELIPSEPDVSIVPDDRLKKGMIKEFSVGESMILKRKGLKIHRDSQIVSDSLGVMHEFDIRAPGPETPCGSLSGGNQQKAVIARELLSGKEIVVFAHPTRGVDINAAISISSRIIDERNKGRAVLLISSDLEEIFTLSDRVSIIFKGKIVRSFSTESLRKLSGAAQEEKEKFMEEIGRLMTGVELEQ